MRLSAIPVALLASVLSSGCSVFGGQAAPEPGYRVEVSEPPFEIRRYGALTVARTVVSGPRDDAVNTGFRRLFDYIRGANRPAAEIPMTAPVITESAGQDIPMTAPVITEERGGAWQVMFVLPPGMDAAEAPRPTDPDVEIDTLPERRVAVVRFSGFLDAENITEQRSRLARWLEGRAEQPAGPWQAAGYNPPWTLPWLRRNEVMVPVTGRE